jgi:hypothetical protein
MPKTPIKSAMYAPLKCKIKGNKLHISLGIDTLIWEAFEMEDRCSGIPTLGILDRKGLAKDIAGYMLEEREDGSSLLSDFIDKACLRTYQDGTEYLRHGG